MVCPSCGRTFEGRFCPNCGADIQTPPPSPTLWELFWNTVAGIAGAAWNAVVAVGQFFVNVGKWLVDAAIGIAIEYMAYSVLPLMGRQSELQSPSSPSPQPDMSVQIFSHRGRAIVADLDFLPLLRLGPRIPLAVP